MRRSPEEEARRKATEEAEEAEEAEEGAASGGAGQYELIE